MINNNNRTHGLMTGKLFPVTIHPESGD